MNIKYLLAIAVLVAVLFVSAEAGKRSKNRSKLLCFRKLKRNGKCSGIIRKRSFATPEACCARRGQGFAWKKEKIRKNRFRCTSCDSIQSSKREHDMQLLTKSKPDTDRKKPDFTIRPDFIGDMYPTDDPDAPEVIWGPWSPCSSSCGAGWRSRYKMCNDCDINDYENAKVEPCVVNFWCPQDGNWGPWFPWEPCSARCGGGTRVRKRKCNYPPPSYGGKNCPGPAENNQTCNEKPCPVNGGWSPWFTLVDCSVTCGPGVTKKKRRCDSPAPAHGGKECTGSNTMTRRCEKSPCPRNGGWSMWSKWGTCSVTCGQGIRQRDRSCDSPKPLHGGKDCVGRSVDHVACFGGRPCPVDGGWSAWTKFGFCRTTERCKPGFKVRSRSCTEPRPKHGGKPCPGQQYERVTCFNDRNCPRNGSWCEWGAWSSCSATCQVRTAVQVRERDCKCPAPKFGGALCSGESVEGKGCVDLPVCKPNDVSTVRTEYDDSDDDSNASGAGHVMGN